MYKWSKLFKWSTCEKAFISGQACCLWEFNMRVSYGRITEDQVNSSLHVASDERDSGDPPEEISLCVLTCPQGKKHNYTKKKNDTLI